MMMIMSLLSPLSFWTFVLLIVVVICVLMLLLFLHCSQCQKQKQLDKTQLKKKLDVPSGWFYVTFPQQTTNATFSEAGLMFTQTDQGTCESWKWSPAPMKQLPKSFFWRFHMFFFCVFWCVSVIFCWQWFGMDVRAQVGLWLLNFCWLVPSSSRHVFKSNKHSKSKGCFFHVNATIESNQTGPFFVIAPFGHIQAFQDVKVEYPSTFQPKGQHHLVGLVGR